MMKLNFDGGNLLILSKHSYYLLMLFYISSTHIHMTDIELHPYQGLVVELNLTPEEGEDAWECQYCNGE